MVILRMPNRDLQCTADGCAETVRCCGLCRLHYAEARRLKVRASGACRTCGNPVHSRGMCEYHYKCFLKSHEGRREIERAQEIARHPYRKKWYAAVASGVVDEWKDFETFAAQIVPPPSDGVKYFLRKKLVGEPMGPDNYRWVSRRTPDQIKAVDRETRKRRYYGKALSGEPVYSRSARNSILKRSFGITADDYDALEIAQGGVCAICYQSDNKRLAVDHCHETNTVRGLLCQSCNLSLGRMGDDPDRLRRAAAYIERHPKLRCAA